MPHLRRDPVIAYLSDDFQRPYPFEPTVLVDIAAVWDAKIGMLHEHRSQFYEWLPENMYGEKPPEGEAPRRAWLSARMAELSRRLAARHRGRLIELYGRPAGEVMERVEAFEGCEYGSPLDDQAIRRLFPFLPASLPPGNAKS